MELPRRNSEQRGSSAESPPAGGPAGQAEGTSRSKWQALDSNDVLAECLAGELGLPRPLSVILAARGFDSPGKAREFLDPRLGNLSDPFCLPGMSEAVDRIWQGIRDEQKITVFGDYDADGITSTTVLLEVLRELGANVRPFLPRRLEDGYGLTVNALDRCIREQDPDLIVTVDCGTGSVEAVDFAKKAGVEVVVTDHHEISGQVAPATAVVNPKLGTDAATMPLAGVGVAFKVCHGLIKQGLKLKVQAAADIDLRKWLDLVAIGTVTDIVPLVRENRTLVRHGLARMNRDDKRSGLASLIQVAGIKGPVQCYHIGFMIGPRLNAAGRLGSAEAGLELLMTGSTGRARELAGSLDSANRERKKIEDSILLDAIHDVEEHFDGEKDFGIVAAKQGWHLGTIGIVASRLCSRYNRPSVVIALDKEGKGKGSCRSVGLVDMLEVLKGCSGSLLDFGGHKMAAGLSIDATEVETFRDRFNALCADMLKGADLRPIQKIDAWISLREADNDLLVAIEKMRPFGAENPAPAWGVRNIRIIGQPRRVGKGGEHLKLVIADGGTQMNAIAFKMGSYEVPAGQIDAVFNLQEDTYGGRGRLQMNIKDMRPAENSD